MSSIVSTTIGLLALAQAGALHAAIVLNEVHFNPPGPDGSYEFIELKSTTDGVEPCTGLAVVIVNNDRIESETGQPRNIGEIYEVILLGDLSTGTNGLLLLGNRYPSAPRGGPWSGYIEAATVVADPQGLGDSDLGSNEGLTVWLVAGFTGGQGQDVDVNNNAVLDWNEQPPPAGAQFLVPPWTALMDSIGTRDRGQDFGSLITNPYTTASANINGVWISSALGNRDVDSMARRLDNNSPNSALSWYGGKLTDSGSGSVTYQPNRFFGPASMLGEVTPGRANRSASLAPTSFRINEVGLNPPGPNDRFQYVEIINSSGESRSLFGYQLILVDSYNDNGMLGTDQWPGGGRVMEAWDLSSMATGSNGLLLIGDLFSSTYNPFHDLPSPLTGMGQPQALGTSAFQFSTGDLRHKAGFTLFLVQNYIQPVGFDVDVNDDGIADGPLTTLGTIVDQVGFTQAGATGLGRTYSTVDLRAVIPAPMNPHNLSRKQGNLTVSTGAWYGGEFESGSPGFNVACGLVKSIPPVGPPYDPWFGGFRGAGTPGLPNLSVPIDPASPPVPAGIRINEVMINPTNTEFSDRDDNNEYIELVSTNGGMAYLDGLWVVVVDLENGAVVESFPLAGSMAGLNGVILIADNYDDPASYPYRQSDGSLTPFCTALDPVVSIGGNDLPNDGMCLMILRGPKTGAGDPLTLAPNGLILSGDLDPENDGLLIAPATFADEVIDSIAVAAVNPGPGYGWIDNRISFRPHHIARYPDNTAPHTGAAWYYGQISQTPSQVPSLEYTANWAGNFKGSGSPGRPNHAARAGPVSVGNVVINEIHLNPPGADENHEFVEFADVAGRSRSLNGYTLLMFDNYDTLGGTGVVRHFWNLDGMATGDNGLFVLGNRYAAGGTGNPWSAQMRAQTRTGDPAGRDGLDSSLNNDSLGAELDNRNAAFLLVRAFSGRIGYDLDDRVGGGDPGAQDSPGDGVFDGDAWEGATPGGIHDSVMIRDRVLFPPNANTLDGFTYGLADLSGPLLSAPNVFYHPDSFARFSGEMSPNSSTAWYGGDVYGGPGGNDGSMTAYLTDDAAHPPFPAGFTGRVTPGQPNLARDVTSDADGDGMSSFMELAFNSNPNAAGSTSMPVVGTVNVDGAHYAAVTFRRIKGGTTAANGVYAAEGYTYHVEMSPDLVTWTADGFGASVAPFGAVTANPDNVTETVTFRLRTPVGSPGGRAFMRLRIGRQ